MRVLFPIVCHHARTNSSIYPRFVPNVVLSPSISPSAVWFPRSPFPQCSSDDLKGRIAAEVHHPRFRLHLLGLQ